MTRARAFFNFLFPLRRALLGLGLFVGLGLGLPHLALAQQNLVDDSGVINLYDPYCLAGGPDDGCNLESFAVLYDNTTPSNLDVLNETAVSLDSFDDGWDAYVVGGVYQDSTLIATGQIGDNGNGIAAVGGNVAINTTNGPHDYSVVTDSYYDGYVNGGCESGGTCVFIVSTQVVAEIGPPQINSVSPLYAFVGTSGKLTLNGLSFINPFGGDTTTISASSGSGTGFTVSASTVTATQATANYSATLTATTGFWNIGMSYTLGGTILQGVFGNFTVGDPPPSISSVSPNQWTAGQTNIAVTISGSYFGSNPQLTLVGAGATSSITSHTDTGQAGGAQIHANVSVPNTCADGSVVITVTSKGYNGTGFTPAYSGESSSATASATIIPVAGPLAPLAPNILFNGANVAGKTTTVVVGQKITLTGQVPTQACMTVASQQWSLPTGNAVGGYTPTPTSYATGSVKALPTDTTAITYGPFYWAYAGTFSITYKYTLTNGETSPTSTATFAVTGPTVPNMTSVLGNVNVTGTTLRLGTPPKGAVFTGSVKTQPTGGSFLWVQLIQNETAVVTPLTGNAVTCSAGKGLDNVYPYSTGNPTDDNPSLGLQTALYKEETDTFAAQMYLMWSSGLSGSIPVPLGSVTWNWSGDAVQNLTAHTWSEKAGTGTKGAGSFQPSLVSQPSKGYPTWTSVVVNGKCQIQ